MNSDGAMEIRLVLRILMPDSLMEGLVKTVGVCTKKNMVNGMISTVPSFMLSSVKQSNCCEEYSNLNDSFRRRLSSYHLFYG